MPSPGLRSVVLGSVIGLHLLTAAAWVHTLASPARPRAAAVAAPEIVWLRWLPEDQGSAAAAPAAQTGASQAAVDGLQTATTPRAAAPAGADVTAQRAPEFLPPQDLDWPAMPRSAPALDRLAGVPVSGFPIRLRVYIDAEGRVVRVEVLGAMEHDAELVQRLIEVLQETAYVPGRWRGTDRASFQDLEFRFDPV